MRWELVGFYASVISGLILIIGLILNIKVSKINIWPNTKVNILSVTEWALWIIFYTSTLAVMIFTLKPFSEFNIISWIGTVMFLSGLVLFVWVFLILNFKTTFGLKGEFSTEGPYRVCRNPQSTGIIIKFAGAVLMTYSILMILLTALHIIFLLLTVFVEEDWLHKQYGKEYEEYKKTVPYRFIPYLF